MKVKKTPEKPLNGTLTSVSATPNRNDARKSIAGKNLSTKGSCKCRYRCNDVPALQKHKSFSLYCAMTKEQQLEYLLNSMQTVAIKRRRHGTYQDAAQSRRQTTFHYHISNNGERMQVCLKTFKHVYAITERQLQTLQARKKQDSAEGEQMEGSTFLTDFSTFTKEMLNSKVVTSTPKATPSKSSTLTKSPDLHSTSMNTSELVKTKPAKKQATNIFAECRCQYRCKEITRDLRDKLFVAFTSLNHQQQGTYLLSLLRQFDVKRRRAPAKTGAPTRKTVTFSYWLQKGTENIQVCSKTFRDVFQITARRIQTLQAKKKQGATEYTDLRGTTSGSHKHQIKYTDGQREQIIQHAKTFLFGMNCHDQSEAGKEQMHANLSIRSMYKDFIKKCVDCHVNYRFYVKVFQSKCLATSTDTATKGCLFCRFIRCS